MNKDTKKFIKEFDFPNPNWNQLPPGFPSLSKAELTKQEKHLLDGIKLAWLITDEGKGYLYKSFAQKTLIGVTAIILIVLVTNLLTKSVSLTNNVQAKTVVETEEKVVEATISAVFRR